MKKNILLCTIFCASMSWPLASHAQSENSTQSKVVSNTRQADQEPVYSAENFIETKQAKEVERKCKTRDYSTFYQKLEKAVMDAVKSGAAEGKSDNKPSNGSSSDRSSSNNSSESSTKNGSSSSSSGNTTSTSSCSTCSDKAKALRNAR